MDAALATHIASSGLPCGMISYKEGPSGASADMFTITIKGKGGHGAYPTLRWTRSTLAPCRPTSRSW